MALTQQEEQAEKNRRALLEVGSAALPLLLQRRNEAVSAGIKAGSSLNSIAGRVATATRQGINEVRAVSRASGVARLKSEASQLGRAVIADPSWLSTEVVRDINRASTYSESYAKQWLKKANEAAEKTDAVAKAAKTANAETIGSLKRTATTESSEAFSSGRAKYLRRSDALGLLRVWDAGLDSCPICKAADGTIVGAREPFPQGEPGSIHSWCQCSWTLLSSSADEQGTLIQPAPVRPVQVQIPASKTRSASTSVSAVRSGGKLIADKETISWAGRLDAALAKIGTDGGAAARHELRALLKRFGYESKDVARAGGSSLRISATIADDAPGLTVNGLHNWDGSIELSEDAVTQARVALRDIANGIEPSDRAASRLSVLIHEELHGASPMLPGAYQGAAAAIEEATTELAARRVAASLTGKDALFLGDAYQNEIDGISAVLQRYSKAGPGLRKKIDDAIVAFKSKSPTTDSIESHIGEFVNALKLTPKQKALALQDLLDTRWWETEHQGAISPLKSLITKPKPTKVTKKKATGPPKKAAKPKAPKKAKIDAAAKAEKARVAAEQKLAKARAAAEAKAAKAKAAAEAKLEKARLAAEKKAAAATEKVRKAAEAKATKAAERKLLAAEKKAVNPKPAKKPAKATKLAAATMKRKDKLRD